MQQIPFDPWVLKKMKPLHTKEKEKEKNKGKEMKKNEKVVK